MTGIISLYLFAMNTSIYLIFANFFCLCFFVIRKAEHINTLLESHFDVSDRPLTAVTGAHQRKAAFPSEVHFWAMLVFIWFEAFLPPTVYPLVGGRYLR